MTSNPYSNNPENSHASKGRSRSLQSGHKSEAKVVDLKEFIYTLWASKWTILGSILVGGVLALLIAFLQTPLYTSNGTLMYGKTDQGSSLMSVLGGNSALSGLIGSSFGIGGGVNLSNEMKVLESRKMRHAMAKKLLDDPIMDNGRMYPVLWKEWPDDSTTIPLRGVASRISENMIYERLQGTTIIEMTYESPSPLEAAHMVDLAMKTYQEISKKQNIEMAQSATQFLDAARVEIQDSLSEAVDNLEHYMDTHNVVQLDAQTKHLIEQIAKLRRSRYEAQVQLRGIIASIKEYERRINDLKPGLPEKLASAIGPNIEKLQFKVSKLKTKKAFIYSQKPSLKKTETKPKKIRSINAQIEQLQQQIRTEVDSLLASSEEFIGLLGKGASSSVIGTLTGYSQKLIKLRVERLKYKAQVDFLTNLLQKKVEFLENVPENAVELARLKRNVQVQEQLYLAVTKKRAQLKMSAKAELGNGRPLDKSLIPEKPSSPNYLLYLLIGLFTAGVLSVGYITVSSVLSETIRRTGTLKELGPPLLSVVPQFTRSSNWDKLPPNVSQAFYRLANSIIHTDADESNQILMLASSVAGEGRTTVSAYLAVALAQQRNKVIVIETGDETTGLSSFFDGRKEDGLKQIVYKKAAFSDAVKKTGVSGLHFLNSGVQSSLPAGTLQDKEFKKLIANLRKDYDYILFDTPAINDSNDAMNLSGVIDNTVIVTQFGKTEIPELKFTLEQLGHAKATVLGVVLNKYNMAEASEYRMDAYRAEESA